MSKKRETPANEEAGRHVNDPAHKGPEEPAGTGSSQPDPATFDGNEGRSAAPSNGKPDGGGATALAGMDKEQSRLLVQQMASFLRIFGGAYPRLRYVASFLDILTKPESWNTLWSIFQANPELAAALRGDYEAAAAFDPMGSQSEERAAFIRWVTERPVEITAERGDDYYQTRAAVAGIIMIASGFVMWTRSTKDDQALQITQEIITLYFDKYWDAMKKKGGGGAVQG